MKETQITQIEIREIAGNIVNKTTECSNDYDAVDNVILILNDIFKKMNIAVEEIKNNSECKRNKNE